MFLNICNKDNYKKKIAVKAVGRYRLKLIFNYYKKIEFRVDVLVNSKV